MNWMQSDVRYVKFYSQGQIGHSALEFLKLLRCVTILRLK